MTQQKVNKHLAAYDAEQTRREKQLKNLEGTTTKERQMLLKLRYTEDQQPYFTYTRLRRKRPIQRHYYVRGNEMNCPAYWRRSEAIQHFLAQKLQQDRELLQLVTQRIQFWEGLEEENQELIEKENHWYGEKEERRALIPSVERALAEENQEYPEEE